MNYADGQEVRLGDRVEMYEDDWGIVVCSLDTDEYSEDYPKESTEFLERGVMIKFPKLGLIHIEVSDSDIRLIARKQSDA
jgi:hypothetical protein